MIRTRLLRALVAWTFVALSWSTAGVAHAAPVDPTLGLPALQARLDAAPSGTLPGYLKTVVRGSAIETIPLDVLAVAGGATSDSSLIMFQAKGPRIDAYGGIVAGMSGSPIYVSDGGVDKIIGALSYGDIFTLGGTGLATPIESMMRLEGDYPPRVEVLSRPVVTAAGVVDRVVIPSRVAGTALSSAAGAGAFVAKPLAAIFIGGLRPGSPSYERVRKAAEARGATVVPLGAPLAGSASGSSSFSTPLVSGASIAALESRGDLWIGGVGTVTYAASDTVLAFGHPLFQAGETSMYLCNAWIDGIWPSSMEPYKVGRPTALRGTIEQDRSAGIVGRLTSTPLDTAITARAIDADTGRVATSTVFMPSALLSAGAIDPMAVSAAVTMAAYNLMDTAGIAGSADVTTTIRVSDGQRIHTITMTDMADDPYDIVYALGADPDIALNRILSVLDAGLERPQVLSIDLQASITRQRRNATIVGLDLPAAPHEGDNLVRVNMLVHGVAATRTVEARVTIPEGSSLTGAFVATCVSDEQSADDSFDPSVSGGTDRESLAQIAGDLDGAPSNNTLIVEYLPDGLSADQPTEGDAAWPDPFFEPSEPIVATSFLPWVLSGSASASTPDLQVTSAPAVVPYGGTAVISGEIAGPEGPCMVRVYASMPGTTTETLLAKELVFPADGPFELPLFDLTTNLTLRVHVDASEGWAPADASLDLKVAARTLIVASSRRVRYGSRVSITGLVAPARSAGGNVAFEYLAGRAWRSISVRRLAAGTPYAKAVLSWKPPKGTWKVRVRYLGGEMNAGSSSPVVSIAVK